MSIVRHQNYGVKRKQEKSYLDCKVLFHIVIICLDYPEFSTAYDIYCMIENFDCKKKSYFMEKIHDRFG